MRSEDTAETKKHLTLAEAVRMAHAYMTSIEEFMQGKVYALEETEYDAVAKRYFITISLQRTNAPKRFELKTPFSSFSELLKPTQEVNFDYVFRVVEVDEATGRVVGMREPKA